MIKWLLALLLLAAVALALFISRPAPQPPPPVQPVAPQAPSATEQPQAPAKPEKPSKPKLKELLLRHIPGWRLAAEGTAGTSAPREADGVPRVPSWEGAYCSEPEDCKAKVISLFISIFRFTSAEMAHKWLGKARYRAQSRVPYHEAFEIGDGQSEHSLAPDFHGEGFYLNDAKKAKGKEIWFRMGRIVVVMHSGVETDLLKLAKRQAERIGLQHQSILER